MPLFLPKSWGVFPRSRGELFFVSTPTRLAPRPWNIPSEVEGLPGVFVSQGQSLDFARQAFLDWARNKSLGIKGPRATHVVWKLYKKMLDRLTGGHILISASSNSRACLTAQGGPVKKEGFTDRLTKEVCNRCENAWFSPFQQAGCPKKTVPYS